MLRIVSLIASATEIVCSLGLESALVGRSHECDYPESVRRLPVCTEPRISVEGSSKDIDSGVRSLLEANSSVYQVHAGLLRDLRPDVIITQSHCEVCAVSVRDVECALAEWDDAKPKILSLTPNTLVDVWADILKVANGLGINDRGEKLIVHLNRRMERIKEQACLRTHQPRIACIEWIEPLMSAGNWMPELVAMAGGKYLFGVAGQHSPKFEWNALRKEDPDLVLVMPCGFDIGRTRQEMPAMTELPSWNSLQAVLDKKVILADGNQYFNRPGPRIVDSLEILAEILHPDVFEFGHEGQGWERF